MSLVWVWLNVLLAPAASGLIGYEFDLVSTPWLFLVYLSLCLIVSCPPRKARAILPASLVFYAVAVLFGVKLDLYTFG